MFNEIIDWFRQSQRTAVAVLVIAAIACGAFLLNGCDMGDIIKVDTPVSLQRQGIEPKMTLNNAVYEYESWYSNVQRDGAEWRQRIDRGNEIAGLLQSLALGYVDEYSAALGPASLFVTGLTGLFLGRAGTRREKEKSYAKGAEDAVAILEKKVT